MSEGKALTGDVNAKGWLVRPGHTMFELRNMGVSITVQQSVNNLIIGRYSDDDSQPEGFIDLKEEDASLILLSIKSAIEKSLCGDIFELEIEPWPTMPPIVKVMTIKDAVHYVTLGEECAEERDLDISAVQLKLGQFTEIGVTAAKVLRKFEGQLYLNGLTELSDKAADILCGHKGHTLSLDGLTELSDLAAECLRKHGGELCLGSLSRLSDAAAEHLRQQEGDLCVDLDNLPDSAAQILRMHPSYSEGDIEGDDERELTKDIAKDLLANVLGTDQYIDGFQYTRLGYAAAEKLIKHKGTISLESLTNLSDAVATSFSKHEGALFLPEITCLSDTAAESLSKHKGFIDLQGLESLSDSPGHIALAESLGRLGSEHELDLRAVTNLSDAAAKNLSKFKGCLYLYGLTRLSDLAAESLAKHQGDLNIHLDNLSKSAAAILRKHRSFAENMEEDDHDNGD